MPTESDFPEDTDMKKAALEGGLSAMNRLRGLEAYGVIRAQFVAGTDRAAQDDVEAHGHRGISREVATVPSASGAVPCGGWPCARSSPDGARLIPAPHAVSAHIVLP